MAYNKSSFIKKDNSRDRKARKKIWNSTMRYCNDCFYLLDDNQLGHSHVSYGDCLEARDKSKKQDPQMFKKLIERKNNG